MSARPFIWAHRGASHDAPENTMAAFLLAEQVGADGLELDVHLSGDDVPVVIHDETLDRTTDAAGPVAAWTWEQLRDVDAGGWFSPRFAGEAVPGLSEVLKVFGDRLRINIEIKAARAGEAVLATLADFPLADVVVSSFDRELLRIMRHLDAGLPLAVLQDCGRWHAGIKLAVDIGATAFHPEMSLVSRPLIEACRRHGLPVHAWTVDDVRVGRSLWRAGIDGIFTNDPARFRCPGRLCSA